MSPSIELVFAGWMGSTAISLFGCWQALSRIAHHLERQSERDFRTWLRGGEAR